MSIFTIAFLLHVALLVLPAAVSGAQDTSSPQPAPADREASESVETATPASGNQDRQRLNLVGQVDTDSGESRRNENVQFNLIDNNALKELNQRLGATAAFVFEMDPQRSYFGSEFGNAPPPPVHVSVMPPANRIHGNLFYGHLNSVTSARSFFQVGGVKPARENEYGFAFTLPVTRRTTFSIDASQRKIRGQVNGNILVPLPDERTALTSDPAEKAFVEKLISAYPAEEPNRRDIAPRMLNTNSPQIVDGADVAFRLDQSLSDRDQLLLRYNWVLQEVTAFQFVKGQNPDTTTRSHQARMTWVRQWSPATATEGTLAFDRIGSLLVPEKNNIGPMILVSGLSSAGPPNAIPTDRAQNDFHGGLHLRQLRGRHNLTAGFTTMRRQLNGVESDAHLGAFSFFSNYGYDSITTFRMGLPSTYFAGVGNVRRGFRNSYFQAFAGDKWNAAKNLEITLGLRWGMASTPVEVNRLNRFDFASDRNNFAPSIGLAWRLPGHWGVFRAAYGLHYGEIYPATTQQVRFNAPLNYKLVLMDPDLLDPLAGFDPDNPGDIRSVLYTYTDDLVTPYAHQYNAAWEFEPAPDWRVSLGYIGSRSKKLFYHWFLNRGHPKEGVPLTTATIDERRADSRYYDVRDVMNSSQGYFDAFKVTLLAPRWKRMSVDASYWFSKALDLGANYADNAYDTDSRKFRSQGEYDVFGDMKGRSVFDQPHAFLLRYGYAFPSFTGQAGWVRSVFGGWTASAVALAKSGTPFDIQSGSDGPGFGNVDGIGGDRPNLVDPSILGRTIGNPDTSRQLLPRSAFSFMEEGETRGNLGHHVFRRGPIRNVNFALMKSWPMGGDRSLNFRAESINLLNTPQFAEPNFKLANPNFGRITNTLNDGRTFRFFLAFNF